MKPLKIAAKVILSTACLCLAIDVAGVSGWHFTDALINLLAYGAGFTLTTLVDLSADLVGARPDSPDRIAITLFLAKWTVIADAFRGALMVILGWGAWVILREAFRNAAKRTST